MSFHSMGTFEEKSAESSNKNIMKNVKCKYNFKKSWSIAPAPLGWIMQYSPNKCFVLNLKPFLFRLGFATLRSLAKEFLFCEISHFLLRQKKKSFRERIFSTIKTATVKSKRDLFKCIVHIIYVCIVQVRECFNTHHSLEIQIRFNPLALESMF